MLSEVDQEDTSIAHKTPFKQLEMMEDEDLDLKVESKVPSGAALQLCLNSFFSSQLQEHDFVTMITCVHHYFNT